MSDADDNANLTQRGGSGTQQQMQALIEAKGATRVQAAINVTNKRRREAKEGVSPTVTFVVKVVRNFLLGLPAAAGGCVWLWQEKVALAGRLLKADRGMVWGDMVAFVLPGLILLAGVGLLNPEPVEAFFRFLGFGGLIDKIIDRIPFLKAKAAP
jgi:hypothetical protein